MNAIVTTALMCSACFSPLENYCEQEIEKSWDKIMNVDERHHACDMIYYYHLGRSDAFYDILEKFGPKSRQIYIIPDNGNHE